MAQPIDLAPLAEAFEAASSAMVAVQQARILVEERAGNYHVRMRLQQTREYLHKALERLDRVEEQLPDG